MTEIIKANIKCRQTAEDLFAVAVGEIDTLPQSHRQRAWSLLAYRIAEHTGTINECPLPGRKSMSRDDAKVFERGKLPFPTKHGDKPIGQIEIGYLTWLHEKHESDSCWFTKLGLYLNSERVNEEIDEARAEEEWNE